MAYKPDVARFQSRLPSRPVGVEMFMPSAEACLSWLRYAEELENRVGRLEHQLNCILLNAGPEEDWPRAWVAQVGVHAGLLRLSKQVLEMG